MAANVRTARRHVRIHGAEVSTDGESVVTYAEAIALTVALVALLAAAWIAAAPAADADIARPAGGAPFQNEFALASEGTAVQPHLQGPDEVVVVMDGGAPATFGTASMVDAPAAPEG